MHDTSQVASSVWGSGKRLISAGSGCEWSKPSASSSFTRGLAHDINNLLTIVSGNADLALLDLSEDSEARAAICCVRSAAEQAQALTRRLFGSDPNAEHYADMNAVVHTLAPLLTRAVWPATRLDIQLASGLPLACIDPIKARQALLNLVINAGEAIGEGEGTITISTSHMAPDGWADWRVGQQLGGPVVVLCVRDTGCGMEDSTLTQLRAGVFSTKARGRGLGLRVVQLAAEERGGVLAVRSAPGMGSEFALVLPVAAEQAPGGSDGSPMCGQSLLSRVIGGE